MAKCMAGEKIKQKEILTHLCSQALALRAWRFAGQKGSLLPHLIYMKFLVRGPSMLLSLSQIPSPHQLSSFFHSWQQPDSCKTEGKEYRDVLFPKMCIYFKWEVIGQGRNEKNVECARKAFRVVYLTRIKPQAGSNVLLWPETWSRARRWSTSVGLRWRSSRDANRWRKRKENPLILVEDKNKIWIDVCWIMKNKK